MRAAILLRGIAVLDEPPAADLTGTRALLLSGARDPFGAHAPPLAAALRRGGADLDARTLPAGHELSPDDLDAATQWLRAERPSTA